MRYTCACTSSVPALPDATGARCVDDPVTCPGTLPEITGIDGTGAAQAIQPRVADQSLYDNTPVKVDGTQRVDPTTRELVKQWLSRMVRLKMERGDFRTHIDIR